MSDVMRGRRLVEVAAPEAAAADVGGTAGEVEAAIEGIFLTPRVVDARAFEEFAGALRRLTRDAAAQGRALLATTGEVRALGEGLREATRELQGRVETASRVVPTLDGRMARAEALLERAGAELTTRLADARAGIVVDGAMLGAPAREAAEREVAIVIGAAREAVEAIAARIERVSASAETAAARAEGALAALDAGIERAVEAEGRLRAAAAEAESRVEAAGVKTAEMGEWLTGLFGQGDRLGRALDRLVRAAERSGGAADQRG